ncbi:class I SAM-dependent methyltransferase [Streptomyces litchfieldiae]|uniref:Class I SAM-dependent methyltransferase n=1 Tax=Streptomyces litchfieldiae TaxID=3075543 RepID=A0ABU2MJ60_9ACTN|nr:class I SAM-dependent methyltransferase [Streptomyces sp. DSM 44938]MDT0341636.1 class I SAM-dependent methyltransferase [Streptomyces sp. DSM 44938]
MTDWQAWQDSWDRQQEWYLPDREERFRVMLDVVEAVVGDKPRVLDLACGTGSISARVLRRFPGAASTGVDLDPALLTIARGSFANEERVSFVTADLTDPDWPAALPHDSYDAVLTATALHWLRGEPLRALYGQLAGLVRPGGVFLNADHMPDESTPLLNAAERAYTEARRAREKAAGIQDWADWWRAVAEAPELAERAVERFAIYGNPADGDHSDGEVHPVAWHTDALRTAGFREARTAWRSLTDALVVALR